MGRTDQIWAAEKELSLSFTADDMTQDNVNLFLRSEDAITTQEAELTYLKSIPNPEKGVVYDIGRKLVGVSTLSYKDGVSDFILAETIEGTIGGQSWYVAAVIGDTVSGTLLLLNQSGATDIVDGEGLLRPGIGVRAVADGVVNFDVTNVAARNTTAGVSYENGVDYTVDTTYGTITPLETGAVADELKIFCDVLAGEVKISSPLSKEQIYCQLRFVTDNPKGPNRQISLDKVALMSSGELDVASTETTPSSLQFEGEAIGIMTDGVFRFGTVTQVQQVI